MKVVHIIAGLGKAAGTSTFCGEVCNQLAALGHDITIAVVNPKAPDLYPLDPRVHLTSIEELLRGFSGFRAFSGLEMFGPTKPSKLSKPSYDLVHLHGLWSPVLHKVSSWARSRQIPIVWSTHGMTAPWALKHKWWKKCLPWCLYQKRDLKRARLIHCTSDSEIEWNRKLGFENTFLAPLGTFLPEEKGSGVQKVQEFRGSEAGVHSTTTNYNCCLNAETQRRRAVEKVEEWLAGVDAATFATALGKLVAEKTAAGEYRFKKEEERGLAIDGAKRFFAEFSRKIVPLSDGRCVYFAPDARAKTRNGSNAVSWAEYAFHAVSNGGVKLTGKDYHERWYNPHKIPAFASIVSALTTEHCFVRLSGTVKQDAIVFAGAGYAGESVQVVTRLDETGNMDANLSEVTFTSTSKGQKKLPRLVPLTEAVRTVVHHQTTAGSYPPNKGIVANSSEAGKGEGERGSEVQERRGSGVQKVQEFRSSEVQKFGRCFLWGGFIR